MGTSLLKILRCKTLINDETAEYCRERSNRIIDAIQHENTQIRAILRVTGVVNCDSNGENPVEGLVVLLGRDANITLTIDERLLQLHKTLSNQLNQSEELRLHDGSMWILGDNYGICITIEFYGKNASEMGWSDGQSAYTSPIGRMGAYRALLELKKFDQDIDFLESVKALLSHPAVLARFMNPADRMVHAIIETKRQITRAKKQKPEQVNL